ncbi:M55 family metallopeptidase [Breoghania sp.]|uniref:M55 family metallopeptidase n=1 Tax=Breoghania sp. TaxID=2065378 RepID=UPI0029C7F3CE|nr:M55 family metallopeptidase [Breoghania sp.]
MNAPAYRHILIIADIEGSSGCGSYRASSFLTRPWAKACAAMSRDVDAVVKALFDAGVRRVTVKDFHRTAYNLLPEMIDRRAAIVCGYRQGPVPGLGDPGHADGVMMLGMHAAAGTGGFIAHTLTSRLASLKVNDRPLAEVELFAAALASFGIPTLFFSGCPVACAQARQRIPGIHTFPIDKSVPPEALDADRWRRGLARSTVKALSNRTTKPYRPQGPFHADITIRDGAKAAAKMADRWGFERTGARVRLDAPDMDTLYNHLIRLCYLPPLAEKTLPFSLMLFNAMGWLGRLWVRRQLKLFPAIDTLTAFLYTFIRF